ncbi:trypsin-like [Orussus abietinus]|uniref:trypsin-like n=1 Tax=Orussus abietinus TaxID=222816 RepID=UPI0006258F91|nr:trypsin-like [Orussus abietinus]
MDRGTSSKMLRKLVLAVLLVAVAGQVRCAEVPEDAASNGPEGRIIGGSQAGVIPYQLSLRRNNSHKCGAVIIASYWAITTGHCVEKEAISGLSLLAGTNNRLYGGATHRINQIVVHPKFNPATHDNDVALLRVSTPFVFNNKVAPIILAFSGDDASPYTIATISGWGTVSANTYEFPTFLQSTNIPIVDQVKCNQLHRGRITENMLCAGPLSGGKDACNGDAGGPLVVKNFLHGLVSWGAGCGEKNLPGVYTRITAVRHWIASVTGI